MAVVTVRGRLEGVESIKQRNYHLTKLGPYPHNPHDAETAGSKLASRTEEATGPVTLHYIYSSPPCAAGA